MKKLILTFLLLLSISSIFAIDFTVNGINYSTLTSSTVQVSSGTYSGYITITSSVTYNNVSYSVTTIGSSAFSDRFNLFSISLPSSITSIDGWAFRSCSSLSSITIPYSVTNIGTNAFLWCSASITVDPKNQSYSSMDGVLYDKSFSTLIHCLLSKTGSFSIPSSVTSIATAAFGGCTSLSSITIPSSVTSIGAWAFSCSALITVDASNANYTSRDGVLYNKALTTLIQCPTSKTGSFSIPSSVTSIGLEAFYNCISLTGITIPSSVISLGRGAFDRCTGLTSINIPSSVISIGLSAFYGCSSLKSITIPSSVTTIGEQAFTETAWLYNQPNGLVYAGKVAYTYKGTMPVYTTITLNEGTIGIADKAFYNCSNLIKIIIPSSVISIGNYAFYYCSGLTSINAYSTVPVNISASSSVFYNVNKATCILYIPIGSKSLYQAAVQWQDFVNIVEKDFLISKTIQITVPGTLSTTLTSAELTTVESLTITGTIDARDFVTLRDSSPKLAYLYLNAIVVEYTGLGGTYNSSSITNFPSNTIPMYAFYNKGLINVSIPSSVTSIGSFAFSDCHDLTEFIVQSDNIYFSVTDGILFNKDNTVLVVYPAGKTLTNYTIPNSVTRIDNGAFVGCSRLLSLSIPSSVKSIGTYAFSGSYSLTSIYAYSPIPIDLSSSMYVFSGIDNTTCTLYVLTGSKALYKAAYQWEDFTKIVEFITDVPQVNTENIKLYPNPVNDYFSVSGIDGKALVTVSDLNGKTLLTKQITGNENIAVGSLTKGMYIVKLQTDNGVIEKKMLKN